VENVDEDMACRTKPAVEVKGDIDKLFDYWDTWDWHRVTYFDDLKQPVQNLVVLTGFEKIEDARLSSNYKKYLKSFISP